MRPPRTLSPAIRELLVLVGWLIITALYLEYLFDPVKGAFQWNRLQSGKWLLTILWIGYSAWILRMGFEKEIEAIERKSRLINVFVSLLFLGLLLLILIAPAAFVFLSLFPSYWVAAAAFLIFVGVIWLARRELL